MSKDDWTTPRKLFNWLDNTFNFTLDAAASKENALCEKFYTKEDNSLKQPWNGSVFCNPPYSMAKEFAEYAQSQAIGQKEICLLLPVRSDRLWFQRLLHDAPQWQACWITGRLHFGSSGNGAFMYSVIFYIAPRVTLPRYVDASKFNDNGKGGAKS